MKTWETILTLAGCVFLVTAAIALALVIAPWVVGLVVLYLLGMGAHAFMRR